MRNAPTLDLKPWFLTVEDVREHGPMADDGWLDWPAFYGHSESARPIEIDVGCGRGLFLFNSSTSRPDTDWLGCEIDFKEGRRAATRLYKRELPNARLIGGDVRVLFDNVIRPASVDRIHVYYPDPWWKKKHRRRRLFTDAFLDSIARLLKPGGELLSRTDVGDYWEVIEALVDHDERFERLPTPEVNDPEHDLDYTTSFERKKRQAGENVYLGSWKFSGEMTR